MAARADRGLSTRGGKFYSALREELRAFAKRTFELNAVDDDGMSYREIVEGLLERTRRPDRRDELLAELACPPIPEALTYLWLVFCRLRARSGSNGFSISPISWPDIDAFIRHSKIDLAPWEVQIIEELDDLFRQTKAESDK